MRKGTTKGLQLQFNRTGLRSPRYLADVAKQREKEAAQKKAQTNFSEEYYQERAYKLREAYNREEDIFHAAEYVIRNCVTNPPANRISLRTSECQFLVWKFIKRLLSLEFYRPAATILWGPDVFTHEPRCTQLVWQGLQNHSKNLIMGGGSLSKSYSGAVYFGLDYLTDPEWTCIKVISVTRQHAMTNVFAHLKNLLARTIVPVPDLTIRSSTISVNDDMKQGIQLTSIPAGDNGRGRLRGFHPVPRLIKHPRYGRLSRVMVILDEAEEIPEGVWEDVGNILLTDDSEGQNVKIFAATNPRDSHSRFGVLAEPENGWASVDIENDETWTSSSGFNVIRLDGARSENVVEQREVFPGLQTYEGFERLRRVGEKSPEYYTMARGWFPQADAATSVMTERLLARMKGTFVFSGPAISFAAVDLAFEGGDSRIFTFGRTGLASGWTDSTGKFHSFGSLSRRVIQLEQQSAMPKADTLDQARAIMRMCKNANVQPAWLAVDRTGAGTGVHDVLCRIFGSDVLGIMFSWSATDSRILEDDQEICAAQYDDIVTEMAFAVRKLAETDVLKLHSSVNWLEFEKQSVARRYRQTGRGFLRLESKSDYKSRANGKSPDYFDSAIMAVHCARMNTNLVGEMVANRPIEKNYVHEPRVGVVDSLDFLDMM